MSLAHRFGPIGPEDPYHGPPPPWRERELAWGNTISLVALARRQASIEYVFGNATVYGFAELPDDAGLEHGACALVLQRGRPFLVFLSRRGRGLWFIGVGDRPSPNPFLVAFVCDEKCAREAL